EAGHASLVVRYRSQVAEFEVSDTGIGIPASDLERIFEPFERGRDPAVRALPGTGLGLTITKLLTQIMGGELLVRSAPREGTTLTCRLLLSEAAHDPAVVDPPRPVRGYTGARRTILLADDDPDHLHLLRDLLTALDFTVVLASNGQSCLELAAVHKPDLVLLDISLPDMTGWQVAQALRRAEEAELGAGPGSEESTRYRLKIIIVSANAHEYRPGGDGASPHDGFIMKPVEFETLLSQTSELLRLQWLYETVPQATITAAETLPEISGASVEHLEALYQLGRIGHVRGIEAKLREIEQQDAATSVLAARLRTLISNFDLKRYMSVLEELRSRG
ncbi:MAG TPA: ATP-binding protein, partial [Steroidobacteraceae bacterium]|nr:ATP-binding protein [Steroidobacteraceae bacterium]